MVYFPQFGADYVRQVDEGHQPTFQTSLISSAPNQPAS